MVKKHSSAILKNSERGASEVFMLVLMTALLAFAGLAYDAGMAFNARRDATNIAASAARAGADDVSTNALYGLGEARIDNNYAGAAQRVIPSEARVLEIRRQSNAQELFVKIEMEHEPVFLQMIGIGTLTVTGEATARVQGGQR